MVITKEFIWLHFGKTAGTSFRNSLISLFPSSFVVPDTKPWKHANFDVLKRYGIQVDLNLPVACGFRRLDSWAESHLRQQFGQNIPLSAVEDTLRGNLVLSNNSKAKKTSIFEGVVTLDDLFCYYYKDINPYPLRTEHLETDFINFYTSIKGNRSTPDEIKNSLLQKLNVKHYERGKLFTREQIELLYYSSPIWKAYEAKIYNN